MKTKLLIMVAICTIAFTANAQTEKGKNLINGSIGFTSYTDGSRNDNGLYDIDSKSFNVIPSFGHFFSNNLVIGIGVGYTQNKNVSTSYIFSNGSLNSYTIKQTAKQTSYYINPFIRRYVDIVEKFKFFGQLNTSIGIGKNYQHTSIITAADNYMWTEGKFTTYNASINPGFAFFPSKKWAVEFGFPLLSYSKERPKGGGTGTENFSIATSSFNPNIGFNFHF